VGRAERKHAGAVDQDVDLAVQRESLGGERAGGGGIAQVGGDEIGLAAGRADRRKRACAAPGVAADDDDMNAGLRQFSRRRGRCRWSLR
jgi:hypothetical protein